MNRELRDLQTQLAAAEQEARLAIGEGDVTKAESKMDEVRSLRKRIAMLEELDAQARAEARPSQSAGEVRDRQELESQYTKAFVKALARKRMTADDLDVINSYHKEYRAAMHSGGVETDPDGDTSLLVPEDVQTRINTIMRSLDDLSQVIRFERVTRASGSRVLEKDEDMTPLQVVEEYGEIPEMDNPKFVGIKYTLAKRAGFLPLTNELLADSDQNILAYVSDWCARKIVVTRNHLIISLLSTLTPKTLADVTAIKRVLNVDLDPAISRGAVLLTNQDGFNWLDEQVDQQGRDLLQPDPTQPTRKLFKGRPVEVVSNKTLPSTVLPDESIMAPLFIGNLKQLAVLFTTGRAELASTKVGGEAWRRDSTEMRLISRDDVKKWDENAAVFGHLAISN